MYTDDRYPWLHGNNNTPLNVDNLDLDVWWIVPAALNRTPEEERADEAEAAMQRTWER